MSAVTTMWHMVPGKHHILHKEVQQLAACVRRSLWEKHLEFQPPGKTADVQNILRRQGTSHLSQPFFTPNKVSYGISKTKQQGSSQVPHGWLDWVSQNYRLLLQSWWTAFLWLAWNWPKAQYSLLKDKKYKDNSHLIWLTGCFKISSHDCSLHHGTH